MEYDQIVEKLSEILRKYLAAQKHGRFLEYLPPEVLRKKLNLEAGSPKGDWDAIFSWVDTCLSYAVKTNHTCFVNRMWSGANPPSMVGYGYIGEKLTLRLLIANSRFRKAEVADYFTGVVATGRKLMATWR